MKKKLKKQIEKQKQQQDEIEQGMLEDNGEGSDKEGDECVSSKVENCAEKTLECEQESNEPPEYTEEKTLENHLDSTSVDLTNELNKQTLQEKSETASNDAMSISEEQVEPGTIFCFSTN